jgi:predicted kinase
MKLAAYPDHPDSIVVSSKENMVGGKPITELDVWNYYSGVKGKMLEELKGRNLFVGIKAEGELKKGQKPIYVRHPHDGKTEYIRINNAKDFEEYHTGRTLEIHVTSDKSTPYYIIDFDAGDEPFSQTKKITADIADELGKLPEVKSVDTRYTGKRGFHVLGWLKKARDVNDAREFLKGWLKEKFGDRDDVVIGESPSGKKGALGLSPMKVNGGQVALWSLRISGLCCVEVPRAKLMGFEKEDASIDKTYKKATGRPFKFSKRESSTYQYNQLKSNQLQDGLYINDCTNPFKFDKQAESRQSQKAESYSSTYPDNILKYTQLQDGLYKRAVTYIKVDKFWMKPDPLLVTAKKFSFGYTEQKGKERKYTVEVKDDDLEPFHAFVFKILEARRKSILPWPSIGKLKEKVNISSPDAGAIQMELPLRVARAYMERRIAESLPELIFTVGLPGSGKTSWIKSQKGFEVVSLDEIRRQLGNISDVSRDVEVVRIGKSRLKSLLEQGKNVIFDATNIKSQYRKDILEGLPPCKKKAKVFHVDPEEAKRRIKLDIQNKVDRSNVPDEVIDNMYMHYKKTMDDNELQSEGFEVI